MEITFIGSDLGNPYQLSLFDLSIFPYWQSFLEIVMLHAARKILGQKFFFQ